MILIPQRRRTLQVVVASALLLGAAAGPSLAQTDPMDPWEKTNRKIYVFNDSLDRRALAPAARTYRRVPSPLRTALRNFGRNLGEPLVFVNDALQAHPGQAATTLGRFAINSIFGVVGIFDVATAGRIPYHENGFGSTLGRWGVKPGPYVFLPLFGPSTVRDTFGRGMDIALNPLNYASYSGQTAVDVTVGVSGGLQARLDADQELATIHRTSTDPYATLRSYYLQNRQAEVSSKSVDIQTLPDFDTPSGPGGPGSPKGSPPAPVPQPTGPAPSRPGEAGPPRPPEASPQASPADPSQPPG